MYYEVIQSFPSQNIINLKTLEKIYSIANKCENTDWRKILDKTKDLEIFLGRKIIILSFQANVFATIISLFLRAKIIIRLNTSPDKYINNFFKKIIIKPTIKNSFLTKLSILSLI